MGTGKVWLVGEQHLEHIVSNIRNFFQTLLPLFPSLEEDEREKSLSEYEAMLLRCSAFVEEELKAVTAEDPKAVLIEIPNTESERAFADAFNNGKLSAEELVQKAIMLAGPITELSEEIWNRFNSFLENFASNNEIDIADLKQDPWVQRIEQLAVGVDDAIKMFNGAYAEIVNGRQVGFADMPDRDERIAELMRTRKLDQKEATLAIDDERNAYMAERVAEKAESLGSVVLICGAAHLAGISANLDETGVQYKVVAQFGALPRMGPEGQPAARIGPIGEVGEKEEREVPDVGPCVVELVETEEAFEELRNYSEEEDTRLDAMNWEPEYQEHSPGWSSEIYAQTFEDYARELNFARGVGPTDPEWKDIWENEPEDIPRIFALVVRNTETGEICGFAFHESMGTNYNAREDLIYVPPELRKHGLFKLLLNTMEETAKGFGYPKLELKVQNPMLREYMKKRGYQESPDGSRMRKTF